MPEPSLPLKLSIGFPGIVTFGIDVDVRDVSALFPRNRKSRGPFLLIGRSRGLALDTGGRAADEAPLLWPPNAGARQLWYFRKTKHRGEYLIVSIDNELVLDAREGTETPREPVMWPEHSQSHQRWRLRPTDNAAAFFIESVRTSHVLDIPLYAKADTETSPILFNRHGDENQQFLIVTPSGAPPR